MRIALSGCAESSSCTFQDGYVQNLLKFTKCVQENHLQKLFIRFKRVLITHANCTLCSHKTAFENNHSFAKTRHLLLRRLIILGPDLIGRLDMVLYSRWHGLLIEKQNEIFKRSKILLDSNALSFNLL